MSSDQGEGNGAWQRQKIRAAAFSFFLWSLPERTPGPVVAELADRLAEEAQRMLEEHRGRVRP